MVVKSEEKSFVQNNEKALSIYNTLYTEQYKTMYYLALRFSKNKQNAEDIVQEAFKKAWTAIDNNKYKEQDNIRGWISTIVYNEFINHYNKNKIISYSLSDIDKAKTQDNKKIVQNNHENHAYNIEERIMKKGLPAFFKEELSDDIYNILFDLNEDRRNIIIACCFLQMEYEEVAAFYSIKLGTVKSRLYRARKEFIKLLKGYLDKDEVTLKDILYN